jgi:lipopolysaccharide export system protein LptC
MDRYSRVVAFLRVVLPMAALALLSSMFLISRGVDTTPDIPFAETEIEARTRDRQVTGPVYSSLTADGDEITVTARTATPGLAGGPARATDLDAVMKLKGGTEITLTSNRGRFQLDAQMATFIGNVVIQSTNGYTLRTEELTSAMDRIEAFTPGEVRGDGPFGDLTAGRMRLEPAATEGDLLLFFTDGVHLIYVPEK